MGKMQARPTCEAGFGGKSIGHPARYYRDGRAGSVLRIGIPTVRNKKKVDENWWNAYLANKRESKEPTFEQRELKKAGAQLKRSFRCPQSEKKSYL